MTVRTIVMLLHFCAALPLVTLVCSAAEDPLRRDTKYGEVEGFADEQRRVWVWKGIPYAKPPRGKLRWRAPQDPDPWKDVLSAKQAPPICTQLDAAPSWIATPHVIGSEDCLYLNVYRPQGEANNLPVYVWIHGGANITGSAREYYVEGLARKANIVVVVIQYRMNVFGYFTHRALRNGASRAEASGNFGLLDQIKALQWIGDNIAAFGGNPFNVTIAGESAGGHNVMGLMICPLARGLFHRVVMQSGGMVSQDLEQAEEAANRAIETAMVMRGRVQDGDEARRRRLQMSDAQLRDLLEELPARELLRATLVAQKDGVHSAISSKMAMSFQASCFRLSALDAMQKCRSFWARTAPNRVP